MLKNYYSTKYSLTTFYHHTYLSAGFMVGACLRLTDPVLWM